MHTCTGCGINIEGDKPYCKRCFQLIHYNVLPSSFIDINKFNNIVNNLDKNKGLFVYIIDVFRSFISIDKSILDKFINKDLIIVINKIDLLPKSINLSKVLNFFESYLKNLNIKYNAIFLLSAKKGYNTKDLINVIDKLRNNQDVYFFGIANSGKSSIINTILKDEFSIKKDTLSCSIVPGTTQDLVYIPYFIDNKFLIDSPGFISKNSLEHILDLNLLKKIYPKKEIKPITYQVINTNSFIIKELVYITSNSLNLVFYISNELELKRIKKDNVFEHKKEIKCNNTKTIFFPGFGYLVCYGKGSLILYLKYDMEVGVIDGFFDAN